MIKQLFYFFNGVINICTDNIYTGSQNGSGFHILKFNGGTNQLHLIILYSTASYILIYTRHQLFFADHIIILKIKNAVEEFFPLFKQPVNRSQNEHQNKQNGSRKLGEIG